MEQHLEKDSPVSESSQETNAIILEEIDTEYYKPNSDSQSLNRCIVKWMWHVTVCVRHWDLPKICHEIFL